MTAALLTMHGGPDSLVVRDDIPIPIPARDQVLVKVSAAGVNNTDIWTREGAYGVPGDPDAVAGWRGVPLSFPRIQGGDVVGYIATVGSDVDAGRIGQRVLIDPVLYQRRNGHVEPIGLLGSERDGGFADYVVVDEQQAHDVSGSPLSDVELACLPIAYGTAMGMLQRAEVATGETVLVTGASGGVGLALVQLASALNARVIAVTSTGKETDVRAAGASATILRSSTETLSEVIRAAEGEIDVMADVVAGPGLPLLISALRQGGRVVIAGAVAGPVVELDVRSVYLRNRRIIGSSLHTPEDFARLAELTRSGQIRPVVAGVYPLSNIWQAQEDFRRGDYVGKLVFDVASEAPSTV